MRHQSLLKTRIAALAGIACLVVTTAVRANDPPAAVRPPIAKEAPFLAANTAAMDRMMGKMVMKPTGDVDADFVTMMIPHHQGAIEMALAVLRYGKNEQIRRIAQEIIVEQQQEIVAMHLALGQHLPASAPAPTQAGSIPGASVPPAQRSMITPLGRSQNDIAPGRAEIGASHQ